MSNIEQFDNSIIELDGVYNKSDITYYISPSPDRDGNYPSCVKRVENPNDPYSKMIMSEKERDAYSEGREIFFPINHIFEIKVGSKFDLNNKRDKAIWDCIKNSPYIATDRNAKDSKGNYIIDGPDSTPDKPTRNGIAELYVIHPGLSTHKRVSKTIKVINAQNMVINDDRGADGQRLKARILGRNMNNQPIADVIDYLLEVAKNNPDKITELYTGTDTSLHLLFLDAKDKHVIRVKNKLYIYGDNIVLGATDDAVIAWMKESKNKKLLELIRKDTYPEMYNQE